MAETYPKEIKLPSGATLKVTPARFSESKDLYQAILEEAKSVAISSATQMASVYKDLFCVGFSSKKIETCLQVCFKHCLYNGVKIDDKTFEPIEARDDYLVVCMEVAKENTFPFVKSLYAKYGTNLQMILTGQA